MPGLKYDSKDEELALLKEWAEGDDYKCFHTIEWWKQHLSKNTNGQIKIQISEEQLQW